MFRDSLEAACAVVAVTLALVAMPARAAADDSRAADDEWHFDFAPYIWIPNLEVDLRYFDDLPPGGSTAADVEGGPNTLDGVLLLNVAARKGDWSLAGDFIYLGYTIPSSVSRVNGGNVDIKQAQPGSTVYLPVLVDGALFSLGDVHAAQGDGEVCGSAIECQATVTVEIDIMKGHQMPEMAIKLDGQMPGAWSTAGWMITTAHGPDLFAASQQAIRYMIDYITRSQKLTAQEAYILCSACVDLKISEIVDAPNWIVSASLPLGIFSGRGVGGGE